MCHNSNRMEKVNVEDWINLLCNNSNRMEMLEDLVGIQHGLVSSSLYSLSPYRFLSWQVIEFKERVAKRIMRQQYPTHPLLTLDA